jgi:hypothetical protein
MATTMTTTTVCATAPRAAVHRTRFDRCARVARAKATTTTGAGRTTASPMAMVTLERRRDVATRAVEDDEGASRDYVKPVQEENALLESETFSTVLKAGFAAFCVVCVLLVFKLAGPVVNEMVSTFPGASPR